MFFYFNKKKLYFLIHGWIYVIIKTKIWKQTISPFIWNSTEKNINKYVVDKI